MSNVIISECKVCSQQIIKNTDGYCGQKCREAISVIEEVSKDIEAHINTDDSRVYFYDIGLGALMDIYTIYLIRYLEQDTFKKVETKYYLGKINESIMTKINRMARNGHIKNHLTDLLRKLLFVNYKMWKARKNQDYIGYFVLSNERDNLKNQIDLSTEGRARISRV